MTRYRFVKHGYNWKEEAFVDPDDVRKENERIEQAKHEYANRQRKDRDREQQGRASWERCYWGRWDDWTDHSKSTHGSQVTSSDITQLFRTLSKKWHPDTGGTTEAMQALNEAKDELLKLVES